MLGALLLAWDAFSPLAAGIGLLGLALALVAVLGLNLLPAFLVRPFLALGLALLVGACLWQAGQAAGAHRASARAAKAALDAETVRAGEAEALTAEIGALAVSQVAEEQAANLALRELNDVLAKDPRRNRACASPADARRLRAL